MTSSDWLDRRKPGQSKWTTQRQEPDRVEILSGVFDGQTTGTPISLVIHNQDQRSKDYGAIAETYRPGHADYTYDQKYGIRDYRGGGRSSARETAMRVAAGAIARKILGPTVDLKGYMVQMGGDAIDRSRFDWQAIESNPFWCPDPIAAERWEETARGGAQVRLIHRGGCRGRRQRCARRPRRADLRQAGRRSGEGDDVDQCSQRR